jgi:hypothetical protein
MFSFFLSFFLSLIVYFISFFGIFCYIFRGCVALVGATRHIVIIIASIPISAYMFYPGI